MKVQCARDQVSQAGRLVAGRRSHKQWKNSLSVQKLSAIAYEKWSPTRGFSCSDLNENILVLWKSGRRREVVAYDR